MVLVAVGSDNMIPVFSDLTLCGKNVLKLLPLSLIHHGLSRMFHFLINFRTEFTPMIPVEGFVLRELMLIMKSTLASTVLYMNLSFKGPLTMIISVRTGLIHIGKSA